LLSGDGGRVNLSSGDSMDIGVRPMSSELTFSHGSSNVSGAIVMRIRDHKIYSHMPISVSKVYTPSDRRVKTDISLVDEDVILQRLQTIEIVKYRYSPEWQVAMGVKDEFERGVIAQQVQSVFPEYIITSPMVLPERESIYPTFTKSIRVT